MPLVPPVIKTVRFFSFMAISFAIRCNILALRILVPYTLRMKVGTGKCRTYLKESVPMLKSGQFTEEQIARAQMYVTETPPTDLDPRIEALVNDLIGRVADKWTMLVLEALTEQGELRFTRLSAAIPGISQKMLTQTLRQMEREGLITRTVHPVVPPKVEYTLTSLGTSLGMAFCGVWIWAAENLERVEQARREFDARVGVG